MQSDVGDDAEEPADEATLPLLLVALAIFGLITMPLGNAWSRWREVLADRYALHGHNGLEGVDEAAVRNRLLQDYNLEIGAGLGPLAGKIWRIGLMGHTARPENVSRLIKALKAILA